LKSTDLPAILAEMKADKAKIAKLEKVYKAAVEDAECALSALQCGNKNDDDEYPAQFMDKVEEHLCNIIEPPLEEQQ